MPSLIVVLKNLSLRWVAIAVLSLGLSAALFGYSERGHSIDTLKRDLTDQTRKTEEVNALLEQQKQAVDTLKKAAKEAEDRANEALEKAKKEAAKNEARATGVLSRKPRGANDCESSVDLINEAIRNSKARD